MEKSGKLALSGGCAGAINGLFGGGGGMAATPSAEKMEQAWQEQLKTLE